jgi:glyoxylase-like metal-dependent hydrolase (beta-lactamase superfamily II)
MRKVFLFATLAVVVGFSVFAFWRVFLRPRGTDLGPIGTIRQIAQNLYMIPGAGGNTAVFVTPNGVVIVDTKVAKQGKAIVDEVRKVTTVPVAVIINTHSHGDHTGGNLDFDPPVRIVAHANTDRAMRKMSNFLFGFLSRGLPTETYRESLSLFSGEDAVDLYYFGPAHTEGDTLVVFRAARVMHAGDVFPYKGVPSFNAGNPLLFGMTLRRAVATIKDVDQVITGHRGVVPWSDFVEFSEFVNLILESAAAAKQSGRTAREAATSLQLPARFQGYETGSLEAAFELVISGRSR